MADLLTVSEILNFIRVFGLQKDEEIFQAYDILFNKIVLLGEFINEEDRRLFNLLGDFVKRTRVVQNEPDQDFNTATSSATKNQLTASDQAQASGPLNLRPKCVKPVPSTSRGLKLDCRTAKKERASEKPRGSGSQLGGTSQVTASVQSQASGPLDLCTKGGQPVPSTSRGLKLDGRTAKKGRAPEKPRGSGSQFGDTSQVTASVQSQASGPLDLCNKGDQPVPSTSRGLKLDGRTAKKERASGNPRGSGSQFGGTISRRPSGTHDSAVKPDDMLKYLTLISEGSKKIRKFKTEAKVVTFKFNDVDISLNPLLWLQNAFDELIRHITRGYEPSDKIGMVLRNDNFPEKPICFSFRRADQLNSSVILATLEKILQSNAAFFANDTLRLHVDRITLPVGYGGSGRLKMTGVSYEEFCRRKQGILVVKNVDNLCLARALVLAAAWRRNDSTLEVLKSGGNLMLLMASNLCVAAGVNLENGGTREHIDQFQQHLSGHTIVVYNSRVGKTVYYEGPRAPDRVVLNLILENQHYNVITNFTSAFSCSYFCELCRIRFSSKQHHKRCKYICSACHASPPCFSLLETVRCPDCNRDFYGAVCFAEHKKSLCSTLKRCMTCFLTIWINPKKTHRCGYSYCDTCRVEKPTRHFCYMSKKPVAKTKLDQFFIFVIYDFECVQEKPVNGAANIFLHEPNLCVAQNICPNCLTNQEMVEGCVKCGKRQHIFKDSPVKSFLNYISQLASKRTHVIALAHNMKGYDGLFILNELVKDQSKWEPKIISTGSKIMSITCGNIKFIDSLNFMPMPLSDLPDTFKFAGSKGYFPFLFNTTTNQNYVGKLPPVDYYCPDEMKPKARATFLKWYNSEVEKNTVFDMQRDIVQYCITDVNILRKACLEFWKIFTEQNCVDPFRQCCTIAGCCMTVFRQNFLQDNTIGVIPHGGYRMGDKHSIISLKWLLWVQHSEGIEIQHAGNGREKRIATRIIVDGFCEATNTVYNFHGCYFHGCTVCNLDQTAELSNSKTDAMFLRYEKTVACAEKIRSLGYTLVEMWECEFNKFLARNPEAAEFVSANAIHKNLPLNPRDAFFGGRTNAVKLYHDAENGEEIKYLDVCSLYPFVNKYGKYPIGHPTVHVGDVDFRKLNFNSVDGLIKVTVLPPSKLYHPVLPFRLHKKLMFILCRTCGEQMNQGNCTHDIEERKFTETYVADELRKAVDMGYQILEFHEIWSYQVIQYDRKTKSGGLFSKYVDAFLKLKQQCSGWPAWCTDDESKDRFIDVYLEREGIALDKDAISFNAGLRYIAKLILNSFWGKLGQRENLNQTSIISDPYEFFKLMTNPSVEVQSIITPNDDVVIVNWVRPDDGVMPLKTVNVVLAAYTTAGARLELYKYLEKLERRVLYFDTDSVVFKQMPGEWTPPTGDFLGDLTDEMSEGSKITTFISGGPKNYAFKFISKDGVVDFVCKVKGITLNYKNSKIVNFDTLKEMILNNLESTYVETDRKIVRTSTYQVMSRPEKKIYKVQYTKRRRVDDGCFDTLPYGYKE